MAELPEKKWYQSSNFWTAAVLLIGGFFVGFPEEAGREIVGLIFALIAAGATVRNYVKTAKPKLKEWVQDANFWNYILAIIVAIVPTFNPEILDAVENIFRAVIEKNVQGILVAVFSLATILYKIFKPEPNPDTATN